MRKIDGSARLRLSRSFQWPPGSPPLRAIVSGALPRSPQPWEPIGLSAECDHEDAYREPVAVANARLKVRGLVLEIPAQVLHAPLIGAQLPALVNGSPDGACALQMRFHRRAASAWEPSDQ